jgi:hypothetical protein
MRLPRRRITAFAIPALAGALALVASIDSAVAQTRTGEDTTRLEAIEVTGSRIKKAEVEGQSPVVTITAADIAATGLGSIGDVIQQLSVSGSSLNTKFNSAGNFGFAPDGSGVGSGSTTIALRNLNAKETLILVDGLRWVNESSASGVSAAVDLNTIPAGVVERIEVLAVRLGCDWRRHQHHHQEEPGRRRHQPVLRRLLGRRRQDLFGRLFARRQRRALQLLRRRQPLQAERDQLGGLVTSVCPGTWHRAGECEFGDAVHARAVRLG